MSGGVGMCQAALWSVIKCLPVSMEGPDAVSQAP
jgi:hypothetical protein